MSMSKYTPYICTRIIELRMTEFEQYKEYLQNDRFDDWRKKVAETVSQKGMYSAMNDTKWLELQKAVYSLPFLPPFVLKCVTGDDPDVEPEDAPRWLGDWSDYWEEGLPPFFDIEWMKVRPRHGQYRGRLIADEIMDETDEFIAILERFAIPYDNDNGTITIYGYR